MLCSQGNAKEGKGGEISTLLELIGNSLGWGHEKDIEDK